MIRLYGSQIIYRYFVDKLDSIVLLTKYTSGCINFYGNKDGPILRLLEFYILSHYSRRLYRHEPSILFDV